MSAYSLDESLLKIKFKLQSVWFTTISIRLLFGFCGRRWPCVVAIVEVVITDDYADIFTTSGL